MYPATDPLVRRCVLAALLVCGVLLLAAPVSFAAAPSAGPAVCPGFSFIEIVSDRNRLIQGSVIIVAFGIALLWWKK